MTELLIRGGKVYTQDGPRSVDVLVTDGVITRVEAGLESSGETVDARGKYVLPGGVDVHVHSRDPGFPDKEDFGSLTAAAAAGGVTVVLDMPNTVPAVDSAGVLEAKAALAHSKARVDFGLWALVRSSTTEEQLEGMAAAGAVGFKAYLAYSFSLSRKQVLYSPGADDPDLEAPADYGTLARLAPVMARLGLPLAIHAEDPGVLAAFRRPLLTYQDLLESRPPEAEAVAVSAAAAVARESGIRLHVAHLSSALGLQAAEDAIQSGTLLTLETCPQFLLLTERDFERVGVAMKMLPPVRTEADREALVDGLRRGVIGIVSTDHAPHTDEEKSRTFEEAPAGSPGVQTLYLSCLQIAKNLGDVWLAPRWVSEAPAAFAGLEKSKGAIAPGFDGDVVIVDPRARTRVAAEMMRSRQRRGALEGQQFDFAIDEVFLRGERALDADRPRGRLVRPASSPAKFRGGPSGVAR
ncbi:MAG TPA: dihydroorotase family protein [Candidatus Limnocylindrales bacterium]|nr:dihydroorotase family protein [Candidatus Limnocylindrales bacterium]